jgi:hypothetical protein
MTNSLTTFAHGDTRAEDTLVIDILGENTLSEDNGDDTSG